MEYAFQDVQVLFAHGDKRLVGSLQKALSKQQVPPGQHAATLADALAQIAAAPHPLDIVLLDPSLADNSGQTAIDLVAQTAKVKSIGVIAKGFADKKTVGEALEKKGIGFVGVIGEGGFFSRTTEAKELLFEYVQFVQSSTARVKQNPNEIVERSAEEIEAGLTAREFTAHFQPIIHMASRRFSGFEALARWHHSLHGSIPPLAFIPVMERQGMIEPLTDIVFQRSIQVLRTWREQGHDLSLAVNFSLVSLAANGFADKLKRQVDRLDISPEHIVVEIGETALMNSTDQTLASLVALRNYGFRIGIDNFGTGQLSPQDVAALGCSRIKVSRVLIQNLAIDIDALNSLENIANTAAQLNLEWSAEGIETDEQWHQLAQLGFHNVQGFLLGKPMDADKLQGWHKLYADRIPVI